MLLLTADTSRSRKTISLQIITTEISTEEFSREERAEGSAKYLLGELRKPHQYFKDKFWKR